MSVFVGIDVAEHRGCAIAALDDRGRALGVKWSDSNPQAVVAAVRELANAREVVIGVDAPRMPLVKRRAVYWHRGRQGWRPAVATDRGHGRHCEVVIKVLGLANPQWTPLGKAVPPWMQLGFKLFAALEQVGTVYEVFPSASYTQLSALDEPRLELSFRGFASGPKDVLDAYLAAVTVREYHAGRGAAVGGGDGLGTIVLPRPVDVLPAALRDWLSH